ncbi:MAG TPA: DUF4232 domain-containing protein [Trebonia sp.]
MKSALLTIPLLAAGVLTAGCAASSSSSSAAAPGSTSSSAGTSSGAASTGGASTSGGGTGSSSAAATASATPAAGAGSTSPAAAGLASCTSADLRVSLGGGAGAGMSQNRIGLQLRNVGSSTCTLYGYPGVSWVAGANGHQVGAAAVRRQNDSPGTEKVVTLVPGALASAPLDIVDAAVFSKSQCKPVPVRGLRVYPPGEKAALFLPLATGSGGYGECSLATEGITTLSIGYLQSGAQPGGGDAG